MHRVKYYHVKSTIKNLGKFSGKFGRDKNLSKQLFSNYLGMAKVADQSFERDRYLTLPVRYKSSADNNMNNL